MREARGIALKGFSRLSGSDYAMFSARRAEKLLYKYK